MRTDNRLRVEGTKALAPALMQMTRLTTVNLYGTFGEGYNRAPCGVVTSVFARTGAFMGMEGATALVPALAAMPYLTSLDVEG